MNGNSFRLLNFALTRKVELDVRVSNDAIEAN